jgi:hypothetical protein
VVAQIDAAYMKMRPTKTISRLISYALFEGRPLTTRGQWINPLVFSLAAIEKRLPAVKRVTSPVYIIGMGRSGTTILGVLLSMHKDIGFLNEPKALWHSIYPDEDVIGNYSRGPARYRLFEKDASPEVVRNARRIFGAYLLASASSRLVDKYPEVVFRVPFIRAIFPDAKFVLLMRNGWDVCASIDLWSKRLGKQKNGEVHDWWGVDNRKWNILVQELVRPDPRLRDLLPCLDGPLSHLDRSAVEWIVTTKEGLKMRQRYADHIYTVKYEDLAQRPREILQGLADYCELRYDEVFLRYAEQVLRPVISKRPLELHPLIRPLFERTMTEAGY